MSERESLLSDLPVQEIENRIAGLLRQRREELGLSQRDLAATLAEFNVPASRSLVNKYELGPRNAGSKLSFIAARALGLVLLNDESGLLKTLDSRLRTDPDSVQAKGFPP